MTTHSCDSYEMREGTLLSSISKVPSAFNLRLCVIIIWNELDPILNLNTFQLHTIMVWHHFNPFQQKWNIPKTFPHPKKKKKKKIASISFTKKTLSLTKIVLKKKFHMSKNNVMNIGKKLEPKKNCTNHCNVNWLVLCTLHNQLN